MTLLEYSKRLILIDDPTHPDLNFGLTFDFSNGHTLGMMLSYLDLPWGLLVYASDLIPGLPWVHLPVTMGYDRFPELLVDEKERLLKKLIRENGVIIYPRSSKSLCTRNPRCKWQVHRTTGRFGIKLIKILTNKSLDFCLRMVYTH